MKKQPDPIDVKVGTNIRTIRNSIGMTQEGLAGRLKITFQQIQKYEKGMNRVSGSKLHQIAEVFGIPVSKLFDGTSKTDTGGEGLPTFSKQTLALAKAFEQIADDKQRAAVLSLVRSMSGQALADVASGETSINDQRAAAGFGQLPAH